MFRALLHLTLLSTFLFGAAHAQQDFALQAQILFIADRDGNPEVYVMDADGTNQTRLTNNAATEKHPGWDPIGQQILFATDRDGNFEVYVADSDGTNEVNLTSNGAIDSSPAWSPDGSKIAFQTDRDGNFEIYVMDPDGSNPVNLTSNAADDSHPRWSADGSKIVFQSMRDGNWEVYVMDADGSNPTNISSNAAADERPNWSPDGSEIVFDTDRDGNVEIYRMNDDGTGQTNLSSNAASDFEPSWSADGTRVSFRSDRDGNNEVYTMHRDGTNQTRLTTDAGSDDQAAWLELKALAKTVVGFPVMRQFKIQNLGGVALNVSSITSSDAQFTVDPTSMNIAAVGDDVLSVIFDPTSDGVHSTTLTFNSDDPDDPTITMIVHGIGVDEPELVVGGHVAFTTDRDGNDEIYVMEVDGSGLTRLTNDAGSDLFPSYSPDGGRIAWQTDRDGDFNVYVMDGDGTNVEQLTTNVATDAEPSFSPDGARIAFMTDRDGNFEIYVMFGDGSGLMNLTSHAANDKHPRWSPDGSKIVFHSDRDGNEEIYSMDPDGSNQTRLTTDGGTDELAQFSPDGTQIAFASDRDGDFELFVMDNDGSNQTQVTKNSANDTSPSWSADGTRLNFTSDRWGDFDVFSMDVNGGKIFRLTDDAANDVDPDYSQVRQIGSVEVDSSEVRTVYVENGGNVTLNVTNITSSDAQFVPSTTSLAVSPFGELPFDLTFTPTSVGFFTSDLTITSDDPETPTVTFTISGDGFTPDPDLLIITDLVYVTDRDGNEELYSQDLEALTETRLTNDAGTDTDPHVSPDGSQIAFSTNRDGNFEIYVIDADGSNPTRLTNDAGVDAFAAWSPTGKQITWQTNRDGNDEIYVMDADGSNPTNITNDANGDLHPRWSPNGGQIVFHTDRDGNNEIYVMDADGSNPVRLTNDAGSDREPDWSPDGSQIAFVSNRDGNDEIYIMDADGSNQTRMTNDAGTDESPTWAPEGTRLAFRSDRDGDGEIWILARDGSEVFQFLFNGDEERVPSWGNYRFVGESPSGIPVSRSMRILNPGIGDLVVSSIVSSDPQVSFSPSSFTVPDHDGQTVTVTYGPTSSTTIFPQITINSNDTNEPVSTLTLAAVGLANGGLPTVVVDNSLIDFDSTAVGSTATRTIAVKNQGAGLLNVSSVAVVGNGFTVSPTGPATVVVGDSLVVNVNFAPDVVGLLVGEVSIHHDDGNNTSPIAVPVQGSGVDAVPVPSFAQLDFGEVEVGKGRILQLTISNVGNIPIQIHDVEPDSGVFAAMPDSLLIPIGQDFGIIDIDFAPDTTLALVDTLRIHHNGSASPLVIPLSGTGTPEPPPPVPILAFGVVNVGAGPLQVGGSTQFPIDISNTGDDTLRVSGITTDLAGLTFSTTQFDVPPGGDSTVVATFAPPTVGPFEGTVTVTHNGAGSPSAIPVDGDVIAPDIGFLDAEIDFGPVQTGTSPEASATLANNGPNDLEVTGIDLDGPFSTDTTPFTLSPGQEKTIPVTFTPDVPGAVTGLLRLFHDDPFIGSLELPIRADVLGDAFETGPKELFMVNPGSGKTVRDTLSFTNLTDSTLVIGTSTSDARFSVDPVDAEVAPGTSSSFVVTFTSDGAGEVDAELILTHNAPGSPPVVVPLLVGTGEAQIALGLDHLQFDIVPVGDTTSAVVRVFNPGTDTLSVTSVAGNPSLGGRFLADPPSFSVAPGDSLDVTVSFLPDGPGSFTDFLVFDANVGLGDDQPVVHGVSVIGTGRGPDVAVAPDRLFFATQDVGQPDSQTVVVTNIGNDTLEVFSVGTLTDLFATETDPFTLGEGESRDLIVIYTPDSSVARTDTLRLTTNAIDTVFVPLEANEIPKNIGNATLVLTRLDSLMSPQVGDTISLALDLKPDGDTIVGVDVFVGVPSAFFNFVDPSKPFTREGLTSSAFVLVNSLSNDEERERSIASLSTSLFSSQTADATLAQIDLVVVAPLEGPAPVTILNEFPVHNSQYLVSSPSGQAFTFKASEPEAFGNLPPRFLSIPLLETEEDGSAELFMNSRVIDPDGPTSRITFAFEPEDSLFGVAVQTLLDTLVTVVLFPPPDAHGIFPVRAIATDEGGASDSTTILINVTPTNDPPTAGSDTLLVRGGGFLRIPLLDFARDIDGDTLTVSTVTAATNGEVVLEGDVATYTPEPEFNGEASFSYVVDDGHEGTASGTVVLNVSGTNARPVMSELPAFSSVVDSPFAFTLAAFKFDPDDSTHTLAWGVDILSGPADSARVEGDLLEVFPLPGRIGEIRLLLALFDPFGAVTAREVSLIVEPVTAVGDLNDDATVDFFDLLIFSAAWGALEGEERFVPLADIDANGEIGLADFQRLAQSFGQTF